MRRRLLLGSVVVAAFFCIAQVPAPTAFAIVGDRTGFTQVGVYQHVWREIDQFGPKFAINVGDSIQGGDDATAAEEWEDMAPLLKRRLAFYPVAGNHDIFSDASERIWRKVTGRTPYYSFDHAGIHVVVLDNSRTNDIAPEQMAFLEVDLTAHRSAKMKLVFFHKPFWITSVMFRNPNFKLHQLARKYGVAAIVSGHVHRFAWWEMEGVQYLMVGSSGGQLRGERFNDGWFFHWVEARVQDASIDFIVHELGAPEGEGRTFPAKQWNAMSHAAPSRAPLN